MTATGPSARMSPAPRDAIADLDAPGGGPGHHLPTNQPPTLTMLIGATHLTLNVTLEKMVKDPSLHAHCTMASPVFQKSPFLTSLGNGEAWVGRPALPAHTVMASGLD